MKRSSQESSRPLHCTFMTNIHSHFLEIKLRLLYWIFSALLTFLVSSHYQVELVYLLGKPFIEQQQQFIFLELTEALYTLLSISAILTLLVILPLFLYHSVSFLLPSFYNASRRFIIITCFVFACLFIMETFMIYLVVLPKICHFLLSFEITSTQADFQPLISVEFIARIEYYVHLVVTILLISLGVLQIPPCIWVLYSNNLINASCFYSNRKVVVLASLVVSALVVPPDLLSQVILTLIFLMIFEFLIFLGLFFD